MTTRSHDTKALLITKQLTVGYRQGRYENTLLEHLNLLLAPGQLVCFMGANGIGKSSLIRTLAGLQKPLSGEVFYAGKNDRKDLPKKISVVLTDKIGASSMSVYELVSFGRYPYLDWSIALTAEDKRIINRSIEQVHIENLLDKKLYELSDGQLQMVMIARALAQDSDIILLDEPTAHLDLNNRVEIMNLLRQIAHTTNKGILIATHELDLALQTADLIWLAGRNKNILSGIPEDLILNGEFDAVFQFKGYDLKTGKVKQEAHRGVRLHLVGEGHEYLWTKNALERAGYAIDATAAYCVTIEKSYSSVQWSAQLGAAPLTVETLNDLLILLSNYLKK